MFHIKCARISTSVFVPVFVFVFSLIFQKSRVISNGDDKWESSGGDGLTVNVSDQVCEAEKDEDGHALNLKGENYFHLPWELSPLIIADYFYFSRLSSTLDIPPPSACDPHKELELSLTPWRRPLPTDGGLRLKGNGKIFSREKKKITAHQLFSERCVVNYLWHLL